VQNPGSHRPTGVVIPAANIKDLMLKKEVVEAAEKGRFQVYAITEIEEGLEILTGKKAGKRKKDGSYPLNSLNARIETRLRQMNAILREAGSKEKEGENHPSEKNEDPFSPRMQGESLSTLPVDRTSPGRDDPPLSAFILPTAPAGCRVIPPFRDGHLHFFRDGVPLTVEGH